jgi:uncharacterized protein with von Willebrand factor type A (vWA) domain
MIPKELPLLDLFAALRQAGLPLGVDEYLRLLCAMQRGFGIGDREALRRLCCALWTHSLDEQRLFDYHFQLIFGPSQSSPEQLATASRRPATGQSFATHIPSEGLAREQVTQLRNAAQVAWSLARVSGSETAPSGEGMRVGEFFPVTRRQMKQAWRHLRRPIREGPATELDMEETVKQIGRQGILLMPVLRPPRLNRAALLLLIDQNGSMVPFHGLSRQLIETAQRGGRLGQAGAYYFHNCPTEYLYRDVGQQQPELFDAVLERLRGGHVAVLIVSDAGAARGGFNPERVLLTVAILSRLKQHVRHLAWLNPMPHERWCSTTADLIARFVPMFEMSRRGMDSAIDALRGRIVHAEGRRL